MLRMVCDHYRWIEKPSSDAVEYPHIRRQGNGEGHRYVEKNKDVQTRICSRGGYRGAGDMRADKGPEEKEKRSHKLADYRDDIVPYGIGEPQHRKAALLGRLDREDRNAITERHLEDEQCLTLERLGCHGYLWEFFYFIYLIDFFLDPSSYSESRPPA
jgi:hypothetical protein